MKLDHLQLAMPPGGEEQARAYFVGLLGMKEEPKPFPLSERGGCWFRSEQTIVHVGVDKEFRPQTKAHPAFIVSDLDKLASQLNDADFPIQWDDALPDRRRFYSTDAHGNRVEFIADGDGFSQRPSLKSDSVAP